jgi:hypothetical protein
MCEAFWIAEVSSPTRVFVRDDALLPDFAGAPPEASGLAYAATDRACAMLARSAKVMIGV